MSVHLSLAEDCPVQLGLHDLPTEIFLDIIAHLDVDDIIALSYLCKRFHHIIEDPESWRTCVYRRYGSQFTRLSRDASFTSEFARRASLKTSLTRIRGGGTNIENCDSHGRRHRAVGPVDTIQVWRTYCLYPVSHISVCYHPNSVRIMHASSSTSESGIMDGINMAKQPWMDVNVDDFDSLPVNTGIVTSGHPRRCPNMTAASDLYGIVTGHTFKSGVLVMGKNYPKPRLLTLRIKGECDCEMPEVFDLPENARATSAAWMATSTEISHSTKNQVHGMIGTSSGVIMTITTSNTNVNNDGLDQLTCTWLVSPGIPIVAIQVDSHYNTDRRRRGRMWAVAINALGEVFYLDQDPFSVFEDRGLTESETWTRGARMPWKIIPETLRKFVDDLTPEKLTQAKLMQQCVLDSSFSKPQYRECVKKWLRRDSQSLELWFKGFDHRELIVDFGAESMDRKGEHVFVITTGELHPLTINRFTRLSNPELPDSNLWLATKLDVSDLKDDVITAVALDQTICSTTTYSEDVAQFNTLSKEKLGVWYPGVDRRWPGGRARFLAIGTRMSRVKVFNGRGSLPRDQNVLHEVSKFEVQSAFSRVTCSVSTLAVHPLYIIAGAYNGSITVWDVFEPDMPLRVIASPIASDHREPEFLNGSVYALDIDPDPTVMRGVASHGLSLRYWHFSGPIRTKIYKKANIQASAMSRRRMNNFIKAERDNMKFFADENRKELKRKVKRYGDLLEDEALAIALMESKQPPINSQTYQDHVLEEYDLDNQIDSETQAQLDDAHIEEESFRRARQALIEVMDDPPLDEIEEHQRLFRPIIRAELEKERRKDVRNVRSHITDYIVAEPGASKDGGIIEDEDDFKAQLAWALEQSKLDMEGGSGPEYDGFTFQEAGILDLLTGQQVGSLSDGSENSDHLRTPLDNEYLYDYHDIGKGKWREILKRR